MKNFLIYICINKDSIYIYILYYIYIYIALKYKNIYIKVFLIFKNYYLGRYKVKKLEFFKDSHAFESTIAYSRSKPI